MTESALICPGCQTAMEAQPLRGVSVDRCPRCLGVWFDAGEVARAEHWRPSTTEPDSDVRNPPR